MTYKAEDSQVERFHKLFLGNQRSYGQYDADRGRALTVKATFTAAHVRAHLEGNAGLGVVPIMDDGHCWWAAIDIDKHGPAGSPNVDPMAIAQTASKLDLPVLVCSSKSGGAHVYVFFKEPQDASSVRLVLMRWASQLGHGGAEIFPKQVSLDPPKGGAERPLGNWINLPYYDAPNTKRFCIEGGKQVTLDYFLELAEGRRCTLAQYEIETQREYEVGPPCLQRMLQERIDEGSRNNAVFQAAVFLKRAYAEEWRPRLELFNRLALVTPLAAREVRQIAGSVTRRDYQYRCREEPCRSLCDRALCQQRAFGINAEDKQANEVPMVDKVEKIIATPIKWRLTIGDKRIELTTEQLFNYQKVREACFERLHVVLPPLKKNDWDLYLREMVERVEEVEDITIEQLMMQRVIEYCRRVKVNKNESEDMRRDNLRRGMPALVAIVDPVTQNDRRWYFAFKLLDLIEYLKRKKALLVPEYQLSGLLTAAIGEKHKRSKLRVGNTVLYNIWCVPEEMVAPEEVPTVNKVPEY